MAVLDEVGEPALTMRAVADRLGVSTMALYHHLPDRRAMLIAVADQSMSEQPMPETSGDGWVADLVAMSRWMRERYRAHPALVDVRRVAHGFTPRVAITTERWMSIWERSGLDFASAVRASILSVRAIVGYIEQEIVAVKFAAPDDAALADYPSLRGAARHRLDVASDAEFDLLVTAIVTGVHAAMARQESS